MSQDTRKKPIFKKTINRKVQIVGKEFKNRPKKMNEAKRRNFNIKKIEFKETNGNFA